MRSGAARADDGARPAAPPGSLVDLNATPIVVRIAGHRAEFLNWGYFEARPWRNYLHSHSFFETCFAFSGSGIFRTGEAVHQVRAGDLFIAHPGDVHEIVADESDPLGIYFWSHTLLPDAAADAPGDGAALLRALADPDGPRVSTRTGAIPDLLALLDREAGGHQAGLRESAAALATALVFATARALLDPAVVVPEAVLLPGVEAVVGQRGAAAARAMIRYLHDNYERDVRVREVAAQVHMSERHASRLFRQATGAPIRAYLQRLRLDVAATLLAERELSVKEIAHACGYPDVRHFTTAFRVQHGMTPAAFRQHNGTRFTDPARQ